MGLVRGMARTAVIAGTATAVSNNVSRRQAARWNQQADAQQQPQLLAFTAAIPREPSGQHAHQQAAQRVDRQRHRDRGADEGREHAAERCRDQHQGVGSGAQRGRRG